MKAPVPGLETNMEMRKGFGRCVDGEDEEQAVPRQRMRLGPGPTSLTTRDS